jgi:hypothetical protein
MYHVVLHNLRLPESKAWSYVYKQRGKFRKLALMTQAVAVRMLREEYCQFFCLDYTDEILHGTVAQPMQCSQDDK